MSLKIGSEDLPQGVTVLAPKGMVDHFTYKKLQDAIVAALAEKKIKIAVDLAGVEYMSSAGVGVLISYREEAVAAGGGLVVFALGPKVKIAFDVLNLEYCATLEEALAALA